MVSQSSSQTTQYVWEKALIAAQSVSSIAVISSSLHGLNERPCGLSCAIVPVWAGTIFVCFVCCMGLLHAVFIFFIWSLWVNEVELLWCHLIVVSILSARCWGFFFFLHHTSETSIMNQTARHYLSLREPSLSFSLQPFFSQLWIFHIPSEQIYFATSSVSRDCIISTQLSYDAIGNKSKFWYHHSTRSLTFLNPCELIFIFLQERLSVKNGAGTEVWRGEREANKDHLRQRISYVGEDNRGVMRIAIDISQESCYISGEAERERRRFLRQRAGHEITREKQIPRLALPVWFIPFFFLFIAAQTLTRKDAKQSNRTLHAVLYNWVYRGDSSRLCSSDKSRWNMRSCHLPSVQTRHGCKRSVCALRKTLFVSYLLLACVWSMLIAYC